MENIDSKKTMKIAMVGVSPADQVTFKGYLRVLLRLDVDLDWVSVQVGRVDLYVVNGDFRNSTSIQKLQEAYPTTPTLYVSRSEVGDGRIDGDVLVLPLKQIGLLNNWLHDNIDILKGIPYQRVVSPALVSDSISQTAVQPKAISSGSELSDVVEMIKTLHARPKANFELLQNGEVIAIIDGTRQLVWLKSMQTVDVTAWRLRMGGTPDEPSRAIDMNQWLYQVAWESADKLLPLVDKDARYQLRSWAKPDNNTDRRSLLRAMVALEDKARTIDELVARTGLSRLFVQKVVVSLLFAQHLSDENYQVITAVITPVIASAPTASSSSVPEPEGVPAPQSAEQEEKLGFLARLRRKLGL